MTEHIQRIICNYNTLGQYQYGKLGVGAVAPYNSPIPKGVNIVPVFSGVSYEVPNYNSLVHGSCVDHVGVNKAYGSGNCVKYLDRSCPGPEGRSAEMRKSREAGYTGPRR